MKVKNPYYVSDTGIQQIANKVTTKFLVNMYLLCFTV